MAQLIGSRQYAPPPKKNFPRGLSPNRAAWRARTVPGGGKEHSVWTTVLCWGSESVVLPHRARVCVCVSLCVKSITDYPSLSDCLSVSLTCLSRLLSQTSKLQRGCAAQNLQMAHAPNKFSSNCLFLLSVTNFQGARPLIEGKRERER